MQLTIQTAMNWERIFAKCVPEEGLGQRIHENLSKHNEKEMDDPIKNGQVI